MFNWNKSWITEKELQKNINIYLIFKPVEGADTNCSVTYIKQNFLSITFLIYMQKIDFPKTMIHITVKNEIFVKYWMQNIWDSFDRLV